MATAIAIKPLMEIDGHHMRLNFHEGQARAWVSPKRFVFMLSGSQSGKTVFGPHWLHREMEERGPGDYLAVTSTYSLLQLKMLPEFRFLFEKTLHLGRWRASNKVFICQGGPLDGSRVIFGSANNPESLESATAKAAWLDEVGQDDFRFESWEAVLRRVALHQGRILGTTTVYNLGWLKQQIYDPWLQGHPDIDVIQFDSTINPAFPKVEFERMRTVLPTWKFDMFYRGEFARPGGLIYSDFVHTYKEDGGHKVRPFDVPRHWPRYVGIDFGAVNTSLTWTAHDQEHDEYYVSQSSLGGGKTTSQYVSDALSAAQGLDVYDWWGGAKAEVQQRRDWEAAGIRVKEPPISDVEAGIDRVIQLFKTRKLFVFDTCYGLLDELGTYSRELDETGQTTEKIKNKEAFHRLDSLRYCVSGFARPRLLPFGWIKLTDALRK